MVVVVVGIVVTVAVGVVVAVTVTVAVAVTVTVVVVVTVAVTVAVTVTVGEGMSRRAEELAEKILSDCICHGPDEKPELVALIDEAVADLVVYVRQRAGIAECVGDQSTAKMIRAITRDWTEAGADPTDTP